MRQSEKEKKPKKAYEQKGIRKTTKTELVKFTFFKHNIIAFGTTHLIE